MLQIKDFECNPFQEKTYILYDQTGECVLVDPGCSNKNEEELLVSFIEKNHLKPVRILLTHGHVDHVCGTGFFYQKYDLKPELHPADIDMYQAAVEHGRVFDFPVEPVPEPVTALQEGNPVKFGNTTLEVIHVPGHSKGSIAFFHKKQKILVAGDVLFNGTIGRTDLPGGNLDTLMHSIFAKLLPLGDEVRVYSGHGPETTIGAEKWSNPFLNNPFGEK